VAASLAHLGRARRPQRLHKLHSQQHVWPGQKRGQKAVSSLPSSGALGSARADQFKGRLRGDVGVAPLTLPYSIEERFANGRSDQEIGIGAQLVDPRDRVAFAQQHSLSAINIPDNEMRTRSAVELDPSRPVFLDCRYEDRARCRIFAYILGDVGFLTIIAVLP